MSTIAHFNAPEFSLCNSVVEGTKSLVKRCIIAIEGTHVCNRGIKYEMPAEMIVQFGSNLNREIGLGRIIPLFRDHRKAAESEFGKLTGFVEARRVTADDLPTPEARDMIGKMAIFANANITGCLDLVKSGAIKALSPGIDMGRKLIHEVSAVPVASMPGVALFRYPGADFSYERIKAENLKYQPLRDETIQDLDTLIAAFRMFDLATGDEVGGDQTQRQESFEAFVNDLRDRFNIPKPSSDEIDGIEYANNPYSRETIIQPSDEAGFGLPDPELDPTEKAIVLEEAAEILKESPPLSRLRGSLKPRGKKPESRRTAGFGGGVRGKPRC